MVILVNDCFKDKEGNVAIRVTHGDQLKTIRMSKEDYMSAYPSGLYEGARVIAQLDAHENITTISPIRWFPVNQDRAILPKEEFKRYDHHEDFA